MKTRVAAGWWIITDRFPHACDKHRWWTGYHFHSIKLGRGRRWIRLSCGGFRLPLWLNYGAVARHISIGDMTVSWGSRAR